MLVSSEDYGHDMVTVQAMVVKHGIDIYHLRQFF